MGVAHGKLDGFRKEQPLRRSAALFQACEHLLEQNSLVSRVLVHEDQAPIGFQDDVESADDTQNSKRHVEQWRGVARVQRCGWWLERRAGSGREGGGLFER